MLPLPPVRRDALTAARSGALRWIVQFEPFGISRTRRATARR